jgi:hypothetical protein
MVNASYTQTLDLATRIKPELIAQELKAYPKMTDGFVGKEIFKRAKAINDTHLVIDKETQTVKSMPYVHDSLMGVMRKDTDETAKKVTVPPMKINARIDAKTLKNASRLKGQDFMAWMRETIVAQMARDKDFSLEYLRRSMITTGNLSYPYLLGDGLTTVDLALGTMINGGNFTYRWDHADTTFENILAELSTLRRTAAKTAGSTSYFGSPKSVKTWCPDAVFNALLGKLNSKQSIDVTPAVMKDEDNIIVGSYTITRNPFEYVKPDASETLTEAITAKQIRMVDVSVAAPHTMGYLELDSVLATGNNKHSLLIVDVDKFGRWVDIQMQVRPVPLFIPEASAKAVVLV